MKKYIVSILVVATFLAYAAYQRMVGTNPATVSSNNFQADSNGVLITPPDIAVANPPAAVVTQPAPAKVVGAYKDGSYTGPVVDAYYGNVQVQAVVQDGKLADVKILQYPNDRGTSVRINTQAMQVLRTEAIKAQSANVNIVSGATDSSGAFRTSLSSALALAKN